MQTLQEAAPAAAANPPARGLAALLPESSLDMGRAPVQPARMAKVAAAAPEPVRRVAQAAADAGARKGVEIEGPLANRKIVAYSVPAFPDWARQQGILEAAVAIHFTVDAGGLVMPGMRVERTSGYGRLDKLAMESLKSWRFAPMPGSGAQWGVITFRFVLE
jgi:TonB family protein